MVIPEWSAVIQAKYDALINNKTWTFVPPPAHRQSFGCKWMFKVKENAYGTVNKYMVRLVAKGFHQIEGFDFTKTFSLVVKPIIVRTVLILTIAHGCPIQ